MKDRVFTKLSAMLGQCVVKKETIERTTSLAISKSGKEYPGVLVESDTHLLTFSSEQVALAMSTVASDFKVYEVITLHTSDKPFVLSPLVVKVLVDYKSRTQKPLGYRVLDKNGSTLFASKDVTKIFPDYRPEPITITRTHQTALNNKKSLTLNPKTILQDIKKYAIRGTINNFPLRDSASGYGTAVYTKNKTIYWAGQYSSPDHRLSMHSEMVAVLSAILDNNPKINHIGVVSSKHTDSPCTPCGPCRQFILEMSSKFNFEPLIHCFAKDTEKTITMRLTDMLPSPWTSKKWN